MAKATKEFPRASAYIDRHGKRRWRHRNKYGKSTELGREYASPEFRRRYQAAEAGEPISSASFMLPPRSISALIAHYYATVEFQGLSAATKATYRGILEEFREGYGHLSAVTVSRRHIKEILERKAKTPWAAKKLRQRLKVLFQEAIELEWRDGNPVDHIKPIKAKTKGFHTWTEREIATFFTHHQPGSVPHTAMTLMLYTGAARVDAVKLGPSNIKRGRLIYVRQKTAHSNGMEISIPIDPALKRILVTIPKTNATFLQTKSGLQRSEKGLGKDMRKWCNAAGLPDCSSHGLRKAIARRLAEAGATPHQIMAVTGHKTMAEVERYTRDADRAKLANSGIKKMAKKFGQKK